MLGLLSTDFSTSFVDFTLETAVQAVHSRYTRSNTNAKPRVLIA